MIKNEQYFLGQAELVKSLRGRLGYEKKRAKRITNISDSLSERLKAYGRIDLCNILVEWLKEFTVK